MFALIFFVIAAAAQGLVPCTFVGSHEDATIDLEVRGKGGGMDFINMRLTGTNGFT
jgi:hypothetical protein